MDIAIECTFGDFAIACTIGGVAIECIFGGFAIECTFGGIASQHKVHIWGCYSTAAVSSGNGEGYCQITNRPWMQ